jgi:collagen type I/II/III/V/XI/XXIV/XXVII alpha
LIDLRSSFAINAISDTPGTVGQNVTLDVIEGETSGTIAIDNVQFTGGARAFFITTNPTTGDAAIETIACFAAGTRIATARGEVAVEVLRVGDLVQTLLGEDQTPIIWIGHRQVECTRHPQPRKVWPVRIAAGAFGPGRPHTDLLLSPDHAVYVNEVLIPAKHLINGSSIAQVPMDRVTYYHLELPRHAVVLAQGLPTESFLDLKDGSNYAQCAGSVGLYAEFPARLWEAFGCAPLIVTGPELAAARALIGCFATMRSAA